MHFKLKEQNLKLDNSPEKLMVTITNGSPLNSFRLFSVILLIVMILIMLAIIFKSWNSDGIQSIKIGFVVLGTIMFVILGRRFRNELIALIGLEKIEIDEATIHYSARVGLYRRRVSFKITSLIHCEIERFPQELKSKFRPMKFGQILIGTSKRKFIRFGQNLSKEELESIFHEIERRKCFSDLT